MTDLLTLEDALAVIDELGFVVTDAGLFASAVGRPAMSVFGEDAYPDLATKVAALLDSVVRNHSLLDGNKRAGWTLAVTTIWLNGCDLRYDEDEAYEMVMSVARGEATMDGVTRWFADRIS